MSVVLVVMLEVFDVTLVSNPAIAFVFEVTLVSSEVILAVLALTLFVNTNSAA
jgi:hypothetical protein